MSAPGKRKSGADNGNRPSKKSKGGTGGQWQTPAQVSKLSKLGSRGAVLEVGGEGIWVTFARGMERKAAVEFATLCDDLGEKMYGISRSPDGAELLADDDDALDIEASIKKELEGYQAPAADRQTDGGKKTFSTVRVAIDCVFFVKTRPPVQPVELCRRICEDAKACTNPMERKTKYINRLTPVTAMDKASEKGIERAARQALSPWFRLNGLAGAENDAAANAAVADDEKNAYTYAIRHSIRNNTDVNHGDLIKQIASLVHSRHKVDLGKPDKVILVDIFQSFCAVGVIDGTDWSDLRKLNVNEMYKTSLS